MTGTTTAELGEWARSVSSVSSRREEGGGVTAADGGLCGLPASFEYHLCSWVVPTL